MNVEDPWLSLELDALWLDEPFDSMCGFSMSDLEVEDAKIWSLRGELTQAARDRGEDEDEFISSGTTTLSELIYARAEDAIFVRATDRLTCARTRPKVGAIKLRADDALLAGDARAACEGAPPSPCAR